MWDRLRSATGGGGAASAVDQYHQGRTTPVARKDRASTLPPTHPASSYHSNSGIGDSSAANSTPSWQPRSSVIAARQGQQQQPPPPPPSQQQQRPPPRPPREFELQRPFEPTIHHQQRSHTLPPSTSHRDSIQGRPPSSVYSQPSPLVTDFGPRATGGAHASRYAMSPDEVSPPSSPEETRDQKSNGPNHDISPIDEEDDYSPTHPRPLPEPPVKMTPSTGAAHASLPSQQRRRSDNNDPSMKPATAAGTPAVRSNIPMMRRERRAQRDAAAASGGRIIPITTSDKPRGQRDPRWDPMTGEITNSDKGRPSQVKPVEFARGLGISTMSSTTPASPERERLPSRSGTRVGTGVGPRLGPASNDHDPAASAFVAGSQRPGWKGASGRTAIVDPVRDDPEVAPLKIPPRSRRRDEAAGRPLHTTGDEQQQQQQQQQQQPNQQPLGKAVRFGGEENGDAMGRLMSPPMSPETAPGNKGVPGGIGGGGSAGNNNPNTNNVPGKGGIPSTSTPTPTPISTGRSLANTLRKIIPTSSSSASANPANSSSRTSRLFSGGSSRNSRAPTPDGSRSPNPNQTNSHTDAEHGYPSPPLSGNAVGGLEGGGSSLVNANAPANTNNNASNSRNANHAKIPNDTDREFDNGNSAHYLSNNSLDSTALSGQHQPPQSIRRKEVASTTTLTLTSRNKHNPHESFSSSVYSRPDDHQDDQPPPFNRQPSSSTHATPNRPTPQLNTKNLPSLPSGAKTSDSPYIQPPSRFSITTYATSAHTTSPRESFDIAPPLPHPPKDIVLGVTSNNTSTTTNNLNQHPPPESQPDQDMPAASVLDRQRPQLRGGTNKWEDPSPTDEEPPVKISLSKAWMSTAGANSSGKSQQVSPPRTRQPKGPRDLAPTTTKQASANNASNNKENRGMFGFGFLGPKSPVSGGSDSNDSRPASVMSNMDKDLPPAPAPTTSTTPTTNDRIAQLNAQLQDLANRRLNIHRAIKQMTELMPQDNLIMQEAVRRKREDEKRKIEELKRKLDDIGREEHELGMKLHRAYKKLDQQTEYEPTTLWVRRATGS